LATDELLRIPAYHAWVQVGGLAIAGPRRAGRLIEATVLTLFVAGVLGKSSTPDVGNGEQSCLGGVDEIGFDDWMALTTRSGEP